MDSLGSILRKAGSNSVYDTAQYKPLSQDLSDNEEEDDAVMFSKGHQNGVSKKTKDELKQELLGEQEGLDIQDLELQKARIKSASEVEVKVMKYGAMLKTRVACFVLTFLLALGLIVTLVISWPYLSKTGLLARFHQSNEWNITFVDSPSESPLRLIDVDGDGGMDVIFGMFNPNVYGDADITRESQKEMCKKKGLPSPCLSIIAAVRGRDGIELWRQYFHSSIFELNCGNIDINKDGRGDCIASGRLSTLAAFNPVTGAVFWRANDTWQHPGWNNYNSLILPDFTRDGVPEILQIHGGDPTFPPQAHTRYAARLIIRDGSTGNVYGKQYLEMPESKESYMSPVMHKTKDGSVYLLLGSGGETVPGSLLALPLPELYRKVNSMQSDAPIPPMNGSYNGWKNHNKNEDGFYEIYRSTLKGVMVPPVCVDVNNDGVKDILMLSFDGILSLFDGETLETIWINKKFEKYEGYSSPTPGHFNDDDVLDFMFHIEDGNWPSYKLSKTVVIDGKNGEVLWAFSSSDQEFSSDLSLQTNNPQRDLFIFKVEGRLYNSTKKPDSAKIARSKRDYTKNYGDEYPTQRRKARPKMMSGKPKIGGLAQKTPEINDDGQKTTWNYPHPGTRHQQQDNRPQFPDQGQGQGQGQYEGQYLGKGGGGYNRGRSFGGGINSGYKQPVYGGGYGNQLGGGGNVYERNYDDYGKIFNDEDADRIANQRAFGNDYDPAAIEYSDTGFQDDGSEAGNVQELISNGDEGTGDEGKEEEKPEETMSRHPRCWDSDAYIRTFSTEVFVMDRTTATKPLRIFVHIPSKTIRNITAADIAAIEEVNLHDEDPSDDDHDHDKEEKNHSHMGGRRRRHTVQHSLLRKLDPNSKVCGVWYYTTAIATGAIGDADGDGTSDLFIVLDGSAQISTVPGDIFVRSAMDRTIIKVNLESRIHGSQVQGDFLHLGPMLEIDTSSVKASPDDKEMSQLVFKPPGEQTWASYLGSKGDSIFKKS